MAKILIIEADANLSTAIMSILEIAGHETLTATDGRAGVAQALTAQPDLVLCEAKLPHLDGYGVLAALRQDGATAQIPFVLLTSHLSKSDMQRGLALGASGFLLKPFTESELLRKLETTL